MQPKSDGWHAIMKGPELPGGGETWGWAMVQALCVALVLYIGGGMLYGVAVQKHQGWDAVPHLGFWRELRGLVLEGVAFARGNRSGYSSLSVAHAGGSARERASARESAESKKAKKSTKKKEKSSKKGRKGKKDNKLQGQKDQKHSAVAAHDDGAARSATEPVGACTRVCVWVL